MKWLRLLVPILLLAALWYLADGEKAVARLQQAEPVWLLVALVSLHVQTVLSALRWRLVARAVGQPMTVGVAVREYYVAQVVNQTVPGGVVGDGARAVRAAPIGALPAAVAAVVVERFMGQAALLVVLAVGFAASLSTGRIPWQVGTFPFVAVGLAGVVIAAIVIIARTTALRRTWQRALAPVGQVPRLVVLSVVVVALNLVAFAATAYATGTNLTPEATVTLIPLILMAMLIPLSIGGWGWREGAAAVLFPLAGAAPEAGLVASATYGVLVLAAALPGALWLVRPAFHPPA